MDYTQRLRDLRADHDMSQAAIAAAIGIDQKFDRQEGSAWSPSKSTSG